MAVFGGWYHIYMKKNGNYAFIDGQNVNSGTLRQVLMMDFFGRFLLTDVLFFDIVLLAKTTRPVLAHGGFFNRWIE